MSQTAEDLKECPFCAELIKAQAILCKHRKSSLPGPSGSAAPGPAAQPAPQAVFRQKPRQPEAPDTGPPRSTAGDGGLLAQCLDKDLLVRSGRYGLKTARDAVSLSIKQFLPLLGAWFVSNAIPAAVSLIGLMVGAMVDKMSGHKPPGFGTLIALLFSAGVLGLLYSAFIAVTLKVARDLPCRMADMWRPLSQVFSCFVVLLISSAGCLVGSFFLVIPGAFLFLKWQLAPYYVVDRNYPPIEALKASWRETNRIFVPLAVLDLGFFVISSILGLTGFGFGIGLVVCNALAAVCSAIVYSRWLTDEDNPQLSVGVDAIEQHRQGDFRISPARDNTD